MALENVSSMVWTRSGQCTKYANVRQWSHFKVMLQRFKVPGLTTLCGGGVVTKFCQQHLLVVNDMLLGDIDKLSTSIGTSISWRCQEMH